MASENNEYPDLVIVGAGLFGLTVAQQAVEKLGVNVRIIDVRDHIGGNAYSYMDPETGAEIQVPLFIGEGEKVKVNTEDGSYLGREN